MNHGSRVREALVKLEREDQEILVLFMGIDSDAWSVKAISEKLGISKVEAKERIDTVIERLIEKIRKMQD